MAMERGVCVHEDHGLYNVPITYKADQTDGSRCSFSNSTMSTTCNVCSTHAAHHARVRVPKAALGFQSRKANKQSAVIISMSKKSVLKVQCAGVLHFLHGMIRVEGTLCRVVVLNDHSASLGPLWF